MREVHSPQVYDRYFHGHWQHVCAEGPVEAPLALSVNGVDWLTFLCTPSDLEALAAGFLFNEGHIQTREEILAIEICRQGDRIELWLDHAAQKPEGWRRTSGCSAGMTNAALPQPTCRILDDPRIDPDQVARLMEQFVASQTLYHTTRGVHCSALSDEQQLLLIAEDIGRHNTLDKLAGKIILNPLPHPAGVVLTTGRISSEMIQKAARLGARIVISRTGVNAQSIEMAQAGGVTLIGYAQHGAFNLYTHPERIQAIRQARGVHLETD